MSKQYIIIVLSIGLVLFFSGCLQTQPEIKYVCSDGVTTVADINACPAPGAATPSLTQEEELSVCSGMPSTQQFIFEDLCIIGIAGKYQDTALCRKAGRDQRTLCYTMIAELKANPDICQEAEASSVNQCYQQYANDKRDGTICGKITDVSYRDSCYSNLSSQLSDAALCDKIINVSQKDSCYFNIAMRFSDISYCDKITNSGQKQSCQQNLQGQQAPLK